MNQRWDSYVFIKPNEINAFWSDRYESSQSSRILYIMGKGFDPRMNLGLKNLLSNNSGITVDVNLISFTEAKGSSSLKYKSLVEKNIKELESLRGINITHSTISIWDANGTKKKRIGDRQAAELFDSPNMLTTYTDIMVDISSLPKGVYFSLVGKILALLDHLKKIKSITQPDFFVITAESPELDSKIIDTELDDDLHSPFGFAGSINLESKQLDTVWLPILGSNKRIHFQKASENIKLSEICPILPFPSINPRRSDDIFSEHHEIFNDILRIEPQNIIYVPEQNPFEVYKKLCSTIKNYQKSLEKLGGCKAVISTFSSKLLSIGALLCAFELKNEDVGILNIDSKGYEIKDIDNVETLKKESQIFLTWLSGRPYDNE